MVPDLPRPSRAQLRAADVRQIHEGAQRRGVAVQGAVVHRGPALVPVVPLKGIAC